MKTTKRTVSLILVLLMTVCMIVPVLANGSAAPAATVPVLYFNIDFEDMAVGAVASGTEVGPSNALWLGVNQNIAEVDGNKVLRTDKAAGTTGTGSNPDHCLYLFRAMGASNLSLYGSDFVVSWDLFVSDDDGKDFNLVAARSPNSSRKWAPSSFWKRSNEQGEGHISYHELAENKVKTSEETMAYGQWNRISVIGHYAAEGDVSTYDIYVNGNLIAGGVKMWFDTDRFTIGKLVGSDATPADCYQMIDNIRCYSGNQIVDDKVFDAPAGDDSDVTEEPTPDVTEEPYDPNAPLEYLFDINFDNVAVGRPQLKDGYILDSAGQPVDGIFGIYDEYTVIAERAAGDHMTYFKKGSYPNNYTSDICLFPFRAMEGVSNFSEFGKDMVISWDIYINDDDGSNFNFISSRSPSNDRKWAGTVFIQTPDSNQQATLTYPLTTGGSKTTENKFVFGQWNRVAVVMHQATAGSTVTSYDVYVNGVCFAKGVKMWYDTDRFTIGKFVGENLVVPGEIYYSVDNIRAYVGNVLRGGDETVIETPVVPPVTDAPTAEVTAPITNAPTAEATKPVTAAPTVETTEPGTTPVTAEVATGTKEPTTATGGCGASMSALAMIVSLSFVGCGVAVFHKKRS